MRPDKEILLEEVRTLMAEINNKLPKDLDKVKMKKKKYKDLVMKKR